MPLPQPRARAPRALASAILLLAASAHAAQGPTAPAPVELRWDAPASCPAAAFHAPLQRYLGARTATAAPLAVHIRLHEQPRGGWRLHLDIAGASARRLTAASCETVTDAAAFVVAQALADATALTPPSLPPETSPDPSLIPTPPDPTLAEAPPPLPEPATVVPTSPEPTITQPTTPQPTTPQPTTTEPPPDPTPPPTPPTIPALRAALRLGGGLSGGALPSVGGELGLLLGLLGPRWRVDLLARGVLPTRTPAAASAPNVRARLGLWTLGARACFVPRRRDLEFPLCAGAEFGQVLARSEGLAENGRAALVWAAVTASPGLAWTPRRFLALVIAPQLTVPLVRHDLVIRGLPAPFASLGPIQAGLTLALELRLPTGRPRP